MSIAFRPGHARRFECLSAAWRPSEDGAFTASKPTVRPSPSSAHGMAATTDTSAAKATLAMSPWRTIRMDRSSFTSDAMETMDIRHKVVTNRRSFNSVDLLCGKRYQTNSILENSNRPFAAPSISLLGRSCLSHRSLPTHSCRSTKAHHLDTQRGEALLQGGRE